jgi:hypothetical protein
VAQAPQIYFGEKRCNFEKFEVLMQGVFSALDF